MTIEVRVPQLPESVADATLVVWHKQPGDAVGRDENLADLETDKVVLEVPAPVAGILKEHKVAAGTTVTSGVLLAIIAAGEVATAKATEAAAPAVPSAKGESGKLAPAARRVVEEKHLDPAAISGSGREGRVTKQDAVRAAEPKPATAPAARAPAAPATPRNRWRRAIRACGRWSSRP